MKRKCFACKEKEFEAVNEYDIYCKDCIKRNNKAWTKLFLFLVIWTIIMILIFYAVEYLFYYNQCFCNECAVYQICTYEDWKQWN